MRIGRLPGPCPEEYAARVEAKLEPKYACLCIFVLSWRCIQWMYRRVAKCCCPQHLLPKKGWSRGPATIKKPWCSLRDFSHFSAAALPLLQQEVGLKKQTKTAKYVVLGLCRWCFSSDVFQGMYFSTLLRHHRCNVGRPTQDAAQSRKYNKRRQLDLAELWSENVFSKFLKCQMCVVAELYRLWRPCRCWLEIWCPAVSPK